MRSRDKENWNYNNRETGYIPAHGMLCQSLDGFERDVRGRLIRVILPSDEPRAFGELTYAALPGKALVAPFGTNHNKAYT